MGFILIGIFICFAFFPYFIKRKIQNKIFRHFELKRRENLKDSIIHKYGCTDKDAERLLNAKSEEEIEIIMTHINDFKEKLT